MDVYYIPFAGQVIVYRPLRPLAFVGNAALVRYLDGRLAGRPAEDAAVESFLERVGYWDADTPPASEPLPRRPAPTQAVLLTTTACNLRCGYCYAAAGEGELAAMPPATARRAVDVVCEHAARVGSSEFGVSFHGGGEPTCHWDLLTATVAHAERKALPVHLGLTSNGVWTEAQRRFVCAHFHNVSLSCDGAPAVQDRQRPLAGGGGSAPYVLRTVEALRDAGVPYGIRMTVMPEALDELVENVTYVCGEMTPEAVQVELSYTSERGVYNAPARDLAQAFAEAVLAAYDRARELGVFLTYSAARPWLTATRFCRALGEALIVAPDGRVTACVEAATARDGLGAGLTVGRLDRGSYTPDPDAVSALLAAQRVRRDGCRSCFCYWHCCGDCEARVRTAAQSPPDSARCEITRTVTKGLLARTIAEAGGVWRGYGPADLITRPGVGDPGVALPGTPLTKEPQDVSHEGGQLNAVTA